MNCMMNHIEAYTHILNLRNIFKRIQQLSWTTSKMEQKFELDSLTDHELVKLAEAYKYQIKEFSSIYDELTKDEPTKKTI